MTGLGSTPTARDIGNVYLCARTMAWCQGLTFDALPDFAPEDEPWEHDKDAFMNTALVLLGFRGLTFVDVLNMELDES